MSRYLAYDPQRLFDLRGAIDAAVWHIASTRFNHAFCEEFRTSVLGIRPRLEDLRDGVLQPVIDSDALEAFVAGAFAIAPIVMDGVVLDEPEEIREYLEAGVSVASDAPNALIVATMLTLTPGEAAAYWRGLSKDERAWLIQNRQDVVAAAIDGGAQLTADQLVLLDRANAFVVFSDEIALDWEVSANLRVATLSLENGLAVVARMMSDGTVQMVVVEESRLGVGAEWEGPGSEANVSAGIFSSESQVFVFGDEATAAAAAAALATALASQDGWDTAGEVVDDWTPLTYDTNFEVALQELWRDYGVVSTDEVGAYGEVGASIKNAMQEGSITAELQISYYDTDVTDRATEAPREGMVISGSLSAHSEGTAGGSSESVEGSFTIDAYTEEDGDDDPNNNPEFVRVTLSGSLTGGAVTEVLDQAGIDLDVQTEAGLEGTVELLIPRSGDQAVDLGNMAEALASGDVDEAVDYLFDRAEVVVTVDATAQSTVEGEFDGGVVEASGSVTLTHNENLVTLHQLPGGEMYSQNQLDATIEREQTELEIGGPLPSRPDGVLYDENDNIVAVDHGAGIDLIADGPGINEHQPTFMEMVTTVEPVPTPLPPPGPNDAVISSPTPVDSSTIFDPGGHAVGYEVDGDYVAYDAEGQLLYGDDGVPIAIAIDGEVLRVEVQAND